MKIPEGYSQEPMEDPPVIHYDQLFFRFIPSANDSRTRIQLFPHQLSNQPPVERPILDLSLGHNGMRQLAEGLLDYLASIAKHRDNT